MTHSQSLLGFIRLEGLKEMIEEMEALNPFWDLSNNLRQAERTAIKYSQSLLGFIIFKNLMVR